MPLAVHVTQPPSGTLVVVGETLQVGGTVDGKGPPEIVQADAVVVQIGGQPPVPATLTQLPVPHPRPPGWFPSWTFNADVHVPGPAGPMSIVVHATYDNQQRLQRTVTVTVSEGDPNDLSGYWQGDDGASYFLEQNTSTLWWVALDGDVGLQGSGLKVTNVFKGEIQPIVTAAPHERPPAVPINEIVGGQWADVPRGTRLRSGTLTLSPARGPDGFFRHLQVIGNTGGFSATLLTRVRPQPHPQAGIGSVLARVNKNVSEGETLGLDNLQPYKDHVVLFGHVVPQDGYNAKLNYKIIGGRTYRDFICLHEGGDLDADLTINLVVDRDRLDAGRALSQPNFWSEGWQPGVDPRVVLNKLNATNGALHLEMIMFGRDASCGQPDRYEHLPLMPGWQELGANSVLVKGRPANGLLNIIPFEGDNSYPTHVNTIEGQWLGPYLRVSGPLVMDVGHSFGDDILEIHPVYAIDVVDATARDNLTGVWGDNFGMTYYLHQVDDSVWWFGKAPMRDESFAQVFHGKRQGGIIDGSWQDVPLGTGNAGGALRLTVDPGKLLLVPEPTGPFSNRRWTKLYDAG